MYYKYRLRKTAKHSMTESRLRQVVFLIHAVRENLNPRHVTGLSGSGVKVRNCGVITNSKDFAISAWSLLFM
jgi:hypothetical protein